MNRSRQTRQHIVLIYWFSRRLNLHTTGQINLFLVFMYFLYVFSLCICYINGVYFFARYVGSVFSLGMWGSIFSLGMWGLFFR